MGNLKEAKGKIDSVMKKSRIHFYKPIQIAEILHRHRMDPSSLDFKDLETFRTHSKGWRDMVSLVLVGRVSTSSSKYQDDIFDEKACPPWAIEELGKLNEQENSKGLVEAYIYKTLEEKMHEIQIACDYLKQKNIDIDIQEFVDLFREKPGLKRSVDKVFEIVSHALFSSIINIMGVTVTVSRSLREDSTIQDFKKFAKSALGFDENIGEISQDGKLYRVGVTNAADRGLDMFSNFGIAIQVKHLPLSIDLAADICSGITADKILIICKTATSEVIGEVLAHAGWGERIQGIITFEDVKDWYSMILRDKKYGEDAAITLFSTLLRDFQEEFPVTGQISEFLSERGYDTIDVSDYHEIQIN